MQRRCRELMKTAGTRQRIAVTRLLHNARIVTDPKILASLNAEAQKRTREEQAEFGLRS